MKTLLSLLSILAFALGILALGTFHLDFGDAAMTVMTAVMFGFALIDGRPVQRLAPRFA